MDTIHDLGGRQGFGPINWQDDDDAKLFHEHWQARSWAICMMMFARFRHGDTGWTIDWHRHVIERTPPAAYLSMNYFDKWAMHMMATLIDDGTATVDEFAGGHAKYEAGTQAGSILTESTGPGDARFATGDQVTAKPQIAAMHTRLPGFVRGHHGVIESYHGPRTLADASACGEIRKEHLYTVRFESDELWPEQKPRSFAVYADLWESYLEPR